MTNKVTSAVLAVYLFTLGTGVAFARHPKVAHDLEGKPASTTVDIIVQFNSVPGALIHQKVSAKGGILKKDLRGLKAAAYSISAGMLESLANDPDIAYISPDRSVNGLPDNAALASNAGTMAKPGLTGSGIAVAVIDSGITQKRELGQ